MKRLRIFLFFLLVPGTIVFALPLFLGLKLFPNDHIIRPLRILAGLCWLTGGAIARASVGAFFTIGQGSPSPVDPPKVLVTSGPFRYSRNPIFFGGLLILLGHTLFFQSWALPVYLLLAFLLFRSIIIYREEPLLRRQYGEAYEEYCRQVPRWIAWRRPGKGR